ncbi:hypothetical protein VOLCADRAFT_106863 [Volvox carteri f. nagariensis]|uniref:Transmembrane protein 138 n=1 Tax=Volvox carteri f. nagariensis TaxID=3068 RepID=D8UA92_VOLCA|nr:uncharacterized protein VOLCADRAFT_106863 [Volvox carteri f. nagariensis]EFJ43436.1 hypothetical protein VOLCADRAFT_106863 [Volvox carteri f. nagariensis]|eukprot:XP_002955583.1 hypothetical protein VOLCADRAFT_106863 [Volvox carteri f. nagariensis]
MGHRRGPSVITAATAGKLLPLVEDGIYRLDGNSRMASKVQAWTNPVYDVTASQTTAAPGDATITVQPQRETDLTEEMFPSGKGMLRRMSYQFGGVMVLIVAHIMVTVYTDPIYLKSPLTQVIVYSAQGGLLLAIIGGFFVLTSQTLYIRLGRYDLYLREFAVIYILFVIEALLYIAMKAYATVLLYRRMSYLALWGAPGYTPLWVVQRVMLMLFWVAALYSSLGVFDVRYFDPELLFGQQLKARERRRGGLRVAAAATGGSG